MKQAACLQGCLLAHFSRESNLLLNRRNSLLPTLFTMESVYHYFGPICVNLRKTAFKKSSMWVSRVSLQNQKNNTKIEIYFIYFHIYNIRCSHILYISRVIVRILDSHSTCYLSLRQSSRMPMNSHLNPQKEGEVVASRCIGCRLCNLRI